MPSFQFALILALHLTVVFVYGYGTINHGGTPHVVAIVNDDSIGPDGPWWYISQSVEFPDQWLPMLPSVSQTSLAINESACQSQTAACPLPIPNMFAFTDGYRVSDGPLTQSGLLDPSRWDEDYAALLNLSGSGRYAGNRNTLYREPDNKDPVYVDGIVMSISANYTVEYSTDSGYTMDAGFFSLNGNPEPVGWDSVNGSTAVGNRTLFQAYSLGAAPSISYGLHIGSVEPNVTGSLVLGGYDISRCLTDPIVSNVDTVQLSSISLNVSSGGYAFLNTTSTYIPDLLRANGSSVNNLPVYPRPGVPHLYLPQDTCDAIASHLPVTYSPEFNLYLWNTNDQAYEDIMSSPHHLDFTFSSDGSSQDKTIHVPFALLNLTLTSPIVSSTTQYFPCKPWKPDSPTGYTLGSAFLQAAFLAQNWQTNKLFLSQAPGPRLQSASVQKIAYDDTSLTPAKNPPSWEVSWSDTLKALPANAKSSSPSDNNNNGSLDSSPEEDSNSSLSGGAIAGIVIGVLACLALAGTLIWYFVFHRRRKQRAVQKNSAPYSPVSPFMQDYDNGNGVPHLGKPALAPHEVEAREAAQVSELWTGREAAELPANANVDMADKSGHHRDYR